MANGTKQVIVPEYGTYSVRADLTVEEARRQVTSMTGAAWLATADACVLSNGDIEFKRPRPADKG